MNTLVVRRIYLVGFRGVIFGFLVYLVLGLDI